MKLTAPPAALFAALFGLLAPGFASAAAAQEAPQRLTIAFTNDVQGYIEPCG